MKRLFSLNYFNSFNSLNSFKSIVKSKINYNLSFKFSEKATATPPTPAPEKASEPTSTETPSSNTAKFSCTSNLPEEKYMELVNYYETEYEKIYKKHYDEQIAVLEEEISSEERETLDVLAEEIASFHENWREQLAFTLYRIEYEKKLNNIDLLKTKRNYSYYSTETVKFWPQDNPDWSTIGGFSSGGGAPATVKTEEKEETKVEEPKKKNIVDVKMTAFEASKKILLIKEIRSFFNLGLKEAKEFVESTPTVLKAGVGVAEAEELVAKFKELATLEIV